MPGEQESTAFPPLLPDPVRAARESRKSLKVLEDADASAAQLQPDVLQSLEGLAELSRLAVAAVGPSSQEGCYRAFWALERGAERIQEAIKDLQLPSQYGDVSYASPARMQELISKGITIQESICFACGGYMTVVRPALLESFFSFEHLVESERPPRGLTESIALREKVKTVTTEAVLTNLLICMLPMISALSHLIGQAVLGFELLGDLADRLQFQSGYDRQKMLSATRDEFSEYICVARACFEELRSELAAGITKDRQGKYYRLIAPLETLLETGHQRFVTVWYHAQSPV